VARNASAASGGRTSLRWASAIVRVGTGATNGTPRSLGRLGSTMLGTTATPRPASTKLSTASISPPSMANLGVNPARWHSARVIARRS